jgi:hypothetical protein
MNFRETLALTWILSVTLCTNARTATVNSPLTEMREGLSSIHAGKLADGYTALSTIPVSSREYRYAFLEMQKLHYRNGDWDRFFGFATFYRKQLATTQFEPETIYLEVLALTKHCQFEAAQRLIASLKADVQTKLTGADARVHLERIDAIEDLLFLQTRIPGNIQTSAVNRPVKAFSSTLQWNISEQSKAQVATTIIKNPRALRVYVKNVCEAPKS